MHACTVGITACVVLLKMASAAATSRKRVVLSIENKLKVLELIDKSVSYNIISEMFGIGRSMVSNI